MPGRPGRYHRQWLRAPSDADAGKPIVFILRFRSKGNDKYSSTLLSDRADFSTEALIALDIIEDYTQDPGSELETNNSTPDQQLEDQDTLEAYYLRFNPDVSPTPSETPDIQSNTPSKGPTVTPGPSVPCQVISLLSDDEDCYKPAVVRPKTRAAVSLLSGNENDGDDVDPAATLNSTKYDTSRQNFSSRARPTMSPTPSQATGASSQRLSKTITPGPSSARPRRSLFSDNDGDEEDQDVSFPIFSSNDVRKQFLQITGHSEHNDDENEDHDDTESVDDGDSEGELVGPGHATPPRYGSGG
jgi:hypothetical protein